MGITIGSMIDEKMMVLDLKLELNDSRILDIEMQVVDRGNLYLEYCFYNLGKRWAAIYLSCTLPDF